MATNEKQRVTDATKLGDLTVGEYKALMRGLLQEAVWAIMQEFPDPDEDLELKPEVAAQLFEAKGEPTISLEAIERQLGLADE
jgi:hypothetical protein